MQYQTLMPTFRLCNQSVTSRLIFFFFFLSETHNMLSNMTVTAEPPKGQHTVIMCKTVITDYGWVMHRAGLFFVSG